MIMWIDDFVILAETQEQAEQVVETLRDALASARGGPFNATVRIAPIASGFEYLGSEFRYREGTATVVPTGDNARNFHHSMRQHLYRISHRGDNPTTAQQYMNGWLEANSLWSEAAQVKRVYGWKIAMAQRQFETLYQGRTRAEVCEVDQRLRITGDAFVRPRRRRSRVAAASGYFRLYNRTTG